MSKELEDLKYFLGEKETPVIKLAIPFDEDIDKDNLSIPPNSLDSVLNQCNINSNKWDVKDFDVKQSSRGEYLWTVHFKEGKTLNDLKSIIDDIKKISPSFPKRESLKFEEEPILAEINCADLHIGKLCWKDETGNNYDIKTAVKIFNEAIDYKINQLKKYPVERILFPIGNDFYQVDNYENTTTAGTRQDVDSRYVKMFREGSKLIIETIKRLEEIAPVDVVVVCGNHARLSEFLLGEVLAAYYLNNENVSIDNDPTARKYYKYGKNLIGYAHGDDIKLLDLPMIMASECPKDWGNTKYRYFKTGHFHHQKIILNEVSGCIIEIVPSLSGIDSWHKRRGYSSNIRSAITALYDKNKGLVGKIYFNL